METKICKKCKKEKPLKNFGMHHSVKNARSSCKECECEYQNNYYVKNIEKMRRVNRESMARARVTTDGHARQRANAKKSWNNGGRERQQAYLDKLKKTDFFKWKARKSYVFLSAKQLKALWNKQQGLCALTGQPLGLDPQLDHIVPKTRGGDSCYENSRWLCADANQAKRNLLDSEFLKLCQEVVSWSKEHTQSLSAGDC